MLNKLIRRSVSYLLQNNVIDEEDIDIYEYGFYTLYNNIIDITSLIVISAWLNLLPQTILYHFSFILLRSTAGGFHAKSHLRCFVLSTTIWLISLWGILYFNSPIICFGLTGTSIIIVWLKAPIEHSHCPLSTEKYKRMKLLSRIFSLFFLIVVFVFYVVMNNTSCSWIFASLAYGMGSHTFLFIITLIQMYFPKK